MQLIVTHHPLSVVVAGGAEAERSKDAVLEQACERALGDPLEDLLREDEGVRVRVGGPFPRA